MPASFCSQCGAAASGNTNAAWTCSGCNHTHYVNPLAVAVAVVPVCDDDGNVVGVLGVQRNIEPKKGQWALPGGFVDVGEHAVAAAVREVQEETGIAVAAQGQVYSTHITPSGMQLLIAVHFAPIPKSLLQKHIDQWVPQNCPETQNIGLLDASMPLAFPLHEKMVDEFEEVHAANLSGVVQQSWPRSTPSSF